MATSQPFEFLLQWHLTERCNLRCSHCYQSGRPGDEMTLEEIRAAAAEAGEMLRGWEKDYGVAIESSCNVTGGEPLLRSDLFAILETIGAEGFDLYLLSNGTLIDGDGARSLAGLGVKGVQVSIEGPPPVHEAIRGAGSFATAIAGVRHLVDAGLPVTLNLTLSRANAGHLEEMTALARSLGARLGLARLVPYGRGEAMAGSMIPAEELAALYRKVFALAGDGLSIVSGDPLAAQLGSAPPAPGLCTPLGGCAAGVSGLTLLPDGTILPCRRLEIPIGNIRRDSLREIWSGSEVLAGLRDRRRYGGRCGGCRRWPVCRGCRAVAWAAAGLKGHHDYLASDPQCFLRDD